MPTSNAQHDVLDKIILNENIYIYKKESGKFYSNVTIKELFKTAIEEKQGQQCKSLLNLINSKKKTENAIPYRFSALVLKYSHKPSFLNEYVKNWTEQKLAYIFLFDFGNYLILLKRNIGGIQNFINSLESLDYDIIAKLFIEDGTLFEKFSMDNLDISSKAMRAKSVTSDSLIDNYNYIGSNTYILNHLRLKNDSERILLSLNTSRISKAGTKISIEQLAQWCFDLILKVEAFVDKESYLDNFAKPCNYQKERATLQPITVTVLLAKLIDDITSGKIEQVFYEYRDRQFNVDIKNYLPSLSVSLDLEVETAPDNYQVSSSNTNPLLKGFKLRLNEKSIRINSARLRKVKLLKENGTRDNLIDYLNNYNLFVVNFDECEMVYSNKKLFKDSHLLGSIEYFLKIFESDPALQNITSEKGNLVPASTVFTPNSMFAYVEQRFSNSDYLVLDDLVDEWADHIAIKDEEITFIHSKYSDAQFSATAFTDIIGQTQKNIGNMFSVDTAIRNKRDKWLGNFKLDNVQSQITRLRKGNNVDGFIEKYTKLKLFPNPKRHAYLALNFISKQLLTDNLQKLKDGDNFADRKQAIQILWFISSLIASCRDNSIEVTIFCKP